MLIVTHPDPAILATVRPMLEAVGCTVYAVHLGCAVADPPPLSPAEGIAALQALQIAPEDLAQEAWADDPTALALARRLAPGLEWVPEDDYEARAPIAEGWARLTRDSRRGYLTVFPGAGEWRWFDDDIVSPDLMDSVRLHMISRCRDYLSEHRRAFTRASAIASRVRGVQALLAGLEAAPVPAEIRR